MQLVRRTLPRGYVSQKKKKKKDKDAVYNQNDPIKEHFIAI